MQHNPIAASIAAAVASRDGGLLAAAFTDTVRLREFAARNRLPHKWIDLERDKQAERLPQRFGISPAETPVVIFGGNAA